jgi:predicted RNase H-like HicB family nuclease
MADGATPAEALGNLQQVMEEWIEVAQELDRSIPEPRGRLLRV